MNKYANPCALCGHPVRTGTGHALLNAGKWATYHKQGDCSAESAIVPDKLTNESFGTIADGFYAMTSSGTNDLVFYAIKTNKGFHNPSMKGQRSIYMVSSIELKVRDAEGNDLMEITLFVEDAVAVGKVLQQLGTGTDRK